MWIWYTKEEYGDYWKYAKQQYDESIKDLNYKLKYNKELNLKLMDFVSCLSWKEEYEKKLINEPTSMNWIIFVLKSLDLIWKLLKEKKVKVQKYEIEEYEKPKEIEKVMFWGKLRKKYITSWVWKPELRLDPCKYKDNDKLEEDVEEWKIETLALYKYVLEKYGEDKANRLLDILEIVRSECYEWEIEIE